MESCALFTLQRVVDKGNCLFRSFSLAEGKVYEGNALTKKQQQKTPNLCMCVNQICEFVKGGCLLHPLLFQIPR
jgi:hypothetical protein